MSFHVQPGVLEHSGSGSDLLCGLASPLIRLPLANSARPLLQLIPALALGWMTICPKVGLGYMDGAYHATLSIP